MLDQKKNGHWQPCGRKGTPSETPTTSLSLIEEKKKGAIVYCLKLLEKKKVRKGEKRSERPRGALASSAVKKEKKGEHWMFPDRRKEKPASHLARGGRERKRRFCIVPGKKGKKKEANFRMVAGEKENVFQNNEGKTWKEERGGRLHGGSDEGGGKKKKGAKRAHKYASNRKKRAQS